jgi:poly-gamma-glutamate capsule biosynthesis protein CapA/YwtB (metallophosphatase superfamily)
MKLFIYLFLFICSVVVFNLKSDILIQKKHTKILVAGDAMFNWGFRESKKRLGETIVIQGLTRLFEEADFRMVNLETPVADSEETIDNDKSYVFNAKVEDLSLLKKIKVDLVFLANNHSMDYGKKGQEDTLKNLQNENLLYVGMGKNISEAFAPRDIKVRSQNFSIVSVSEIGEARLFATESRAGIAGFNIPKLKKIPAEKNDSILLLATHWGIEYNPEPTNQQIKQAKELIDSGYSAIIGHHPHIPQGIQKYKNGIIIYSLGNFIFGSKNQYLNHNITVMLHYEEEKLIYAEIIPIIGKFQNNDHILRELNFAEAEEFFIEFSVLCENLGTKIKVKNGRGYIYF